MKNKHINIEHIGLGEYIYIYIYIYTYIYIYIYALKNTHHLLKPQIFLFFS